MNAVLLIDPDGAMLASAGRALRARREPVFVAKDVAEAQGLRRGRRFAVVVAAPQDLKQIAAWRPAPVAVRACEGAALLAAIDSAAAHARLVREHRRDSVVLRRRERQLRAARAKEATAAARVHRLADANVRLRETATGLVRLLSVAAEHGDPDMPSRGEHVARVAVAIAKRMDLADHLDAIRIAAMLHAVGRLAAFDASATEEERGARLLEPLPFPPSVAEGVRYQHERWDGRGSSTGLSGEAIPVEARIIGAARAFVDLVGGDGPGDALTAGEAARALEPSGGRSHEPHVIAALAAIAASPDEVRRLGLPARAAEGAVA